MGERSWLDFIRDELAPYPQRLSGTLRDTLSVTLAVVLVMTLRVHAAAIGIYYIFLLARQTPSLSFLSGLRSLVSIAAGVGSCLLLIQMTDNDPIARVVGLMVCMAATGFMLSASSLGAEAIAFSLFWFTTLAGWDGHRPAEQTVESSLWVVAATALSVGCAVAVEYVFGGQSPVVSLKEEMERRLEAVEEIFRLYAEGAGEVSLQGVRRRVVVLSHAGQQRMQRVYERIVERNLHTRELPPGTRVRIPMLAELMDLVAAFSLEHRNGVDEPLRVVCGEIAQLCGRTRAGDAVESVGYEASHGEDWLGRIRQTLHELNSMPAVVEETESEVLMTPLTSSQQPIFAADAFTNPQHVNFGLKMSAAATICYVFYNAVGWPGIATSVVTVMITAVSTTAAMKQKQLFRMLGAVLGGGIGIVSVSVLFPSMDSITSLLVLVALVTFGSAWMARSPRTSYVGMQTALAFYLVAFQSFGAPVAMAPARDRVVGVGLGLLVMWFIFDQISPVRTAWAMRRGFATLLRETAELFRVGAMEKPQAIRLAEANKLRYSVGLEMLRLREMHEAVSYEFGADREMHMRESERIMQASIAAAALFWSGLASLTQELGEDATLLARRRMLGENLERMAESYEGRGVVAVEERGAGVPGVPVEMVAEGATGAMARYLELCALLPDTD